MGLLIMPIIQLLLVPLAWGNYSLYLDLSASGAIVRSLRPILNIDCPLHLDCPVHLAKSELQITLV